MTVPLARRNLLHERGKLILSVLGVAASLALVMLLLGFRNGIFAALTAYIDNTQADLVVTRSGVQGSFASSTIPVTIHNSLASAARAEQTEHVLLSDIIFTRGDFKWPSILVGYNLETGLGGPWNLVEGRPVQDDDELVMDTWLARRSGIRIGDETEVLGRRFQVVGFSRETSSWAGAYIFISRNATEGLLQLPGIASFYLIRLPPGSDVNTVARAIESQVDGIDTMTPAEKATLDQKLLGTLLNAPINLMLWIAAITGAAVMGLTAYTGVIDRRREYGVLKAVGADRVWLRRLIVSETSYRAVLGYLLGTVLSYLAGQLITFLFPQFRVIIRPETLVIAAIVTLVITVGAALLPLRRIMAVDPAMVFKA